MSKTDLSIIIISYNTAKITKNCLDSISYSLKNSKLVVEVIIIDNFSNDDSVKILNSYKSNNFELNLIINRENVGFGKANNQGVKLAKSEYILLLNSDIEVLDNAIDQMYNFYKHQQYKINFLGGKLLNKDFTSQPSSAPFYTLPVVFGWIFLRGDLWNLTRSSPDKVQETDWVSGACILTKKEYYNSVGGFDEGIFMYMDEVDLLYRAKRKGFTVYFYPDARFIHLGSASSGKRTFPILQAYKGLLYFYRKHYSTSALFMLKTMLKLKALIGVAIGQLKNNNYLKETYGQAYKMVDMDR